MGNNEKDNFYAYGYQRGLEDENIKRIKNQISREYGEEAAFEFLAGFITAQEDLYLKNKSVDHEIKRGGPSRNDEFIDADMVDSYIDYDPNLRNNSLYGGNGVSSIYDKDGKFIDPPISGKGKPK